MKYKKLKNGKYEIINSKNEKIITYDEIILKYNLLYKDDFEYEIINTENQYYDIYYKCIKLIKRKLRTKKEIKKIANEKIVNQLINEKYIDDIKYAKSFIHDKLILSNDGPLKIKYKLLINGIDENIINQEIKNIDINIFKNKIVKLFNDNNSFEKNIKFLLNKGYSYDLIKETIKKRN